MPPKPPCPSVQAAVRWRACGEVRARAGNKPLMGRHYVDAMIELAYFLDVIMNEPRKAIYWFRRARRVTRYYFKEIEDGIKNVGDSFAIQ